MARQLAAKRPTASAVQRFCRGWRGGYSALRRDPAIRVRFELDKGQWEEGELQLGGIKTVMDLRQQVRSMCCWRASGPPAGHAAHRPDCCPFSSRDLPVILPRLTPHCSHVPAPRRPPLPPCSTPIDLPLPRLAAAAPRGRSAARRGGGPRGVVAALHGRRRRAAAHHVTHADGRAADGGAGVARHRGYHQSRYGG